MVLTIYPLLAQPDIPHQQEFSSMTVALFVGLILVYLSVAFWLGCKTKWSRWWQVLGLLSLVATIIWLICYLVIGLVVILSRPSDIMGNGVGYRATFSVPMEEWNLPGRFFSIPNNEIPVLLQLGCTTAAVWGVLFALGLVPYSLAQTLAKAVRGTRQGGGAVT